MALPHIPTHAERWAEVRKRVLCLDESDMGHHPSIAAAIQELLHPTECTEAQASGEENIEDPAD